MQSIWRSPELICVVVKIHIFLQNPYPESVEKVIGFKMFAPGFPMGTSEQEPGDQHDVQHQEHVDQFELGFTGLVVC